MNSASSKFRREVFWPGHFKRTSLLQLCPRHLATVEHIAKRKNYHAASQHDFMLENYNQIFGAPLMPASKAVPSDQLRKSLMILRMLSMVEERRDEIEENEARCASTQHLIQSEPRT
jgi:hypothetical protein